MWYTFLKWVRYGCSYVTNLMGNMQNETLNEYFFSLHTITLEILWGSCRTATAT